MDIDDLVFEEIVDEVWSEIPSNFKEEIENVSIVIEDDPDAGYQKNLAKGGLLLGLFEGIPKTQWGTTYFGTQPSKITIFKNPILQVSQNMKDLRITVHVVLMHEIAHYFGYNEEHLFVMDKKLRDKLLEKFSSEESSK
jgi:predicted Zn-dependent protease with MMP-like domain